MLHKLFTLAVTALLMLMIVCLPASASIDPWSGVDHNNTGDGNGGVTPGINPGGGTTSNGSITPATRLTYIVIFTGSSYYSAIKVFRVNLKSRTTKTITSTTVVAPSNTSGK